MSSGVYFVDDEPALAQRLAEYLERLAGSLAASPAAAGTVALVLSGGYGRGEGGVFRDAENRPDLYNDLEFYMLLVDQGAETAAREWCEQHERDGTIELGIDVEFKRMPIVGLTTGEPSMFYYDLMQGNRLIWGRQDWAVSVPAELSDAGLIPLHEATRLMFNRGSGMFFSRCALAQNDERIASGFVERNHNKVKIALGDAVLAANGQYHHFCRERNRRVVAGLADTPPHWEQLMAWHSEGTAFKLSPRHTVVAKETLIAAQAELTEAWLGTLLWLEGKRLGRSFPNAAAYVQGSGRLFPETPRWRNVALRLRDRRSRGGALPYWTDYPRAALMRVLVDLVDPSAEPDAGIVARGLGEPAETSVNGWTNLEKAYTRWWAFYN